MLAVAMIGTSSRYARRWLLFAACVLIGLLNEVSGGVLTVALPQLKGDLGMSQVGAQLILTTAKLFFGALILHGGVGPFRNGGFRGCNDGCPGP